MPSLFTKIIQGDIPSHKVFENEDYLAFLDIRPINPGHTLVIPKREIDYLFDLDDHLYEGLFLVSKKIARAIKKAVPCQRIGIMVAGLEVPHAHVHLVPINSIGDLTFARAKQADQKDLADLTKEIRAHLRFS